MKQHNKKVMIISIVAGILLLIAGVSGLATWTAIEEFVTENISDEYIVQIAFAILIFIASLGGISVILGGLLIGKDKIGLGKFLIILGAGMGIIGLIVSIYYAYGSGGLDIWSFFSIGFIGLLLSIIARMMVKK